MTDKAQSFSQGFVPGFEFDVFVSYARATDHSEPEETGWVTDFQRRLSKILAIDCPEKKIFFDVRSIDGNANLDERIVSAVHRSAVFVVILAPVYLSRTYCLKELHTFRSWVDESEHCDRTFLVHYHWVPLDERPEFLRQQTGYNFYWEDPKNPSIRIPINYTTQRELYDRSIYVLSGAITKQLKAMKTASAQESGLNTRADNDNTVGPVNRLAPERFELTRLPTVSGSFFGRLDEVKRIHAASENPNEHVLSIVARGGEGKTSLITNWLNELNQNSWAGYHRAFAWSFYSQGTNDRVSNADEFMAAARKFFQDKAPDEILTPHQQGKRLAELVSRERNLIILDGLEPLQYPPGSKSGMIKDLSLQVFLKSLANMNNGLCVITTREPVTELQSYKSMSCPELSLAPMDVDRGSEFLRSLGVKGTDERLAEVVATLDGHALSLELIGSYINQSYDGQVELWDSKTLPTFDDRVSNHADRVLLSYENWLSGKNLGSSVANESGGNYSTLGLKLLQIVRLFGLFDRPVAADLIVSLSLTPEIGGLNESFVGNRRDEIARVLHRLCTMRFLRKTGADTASSGEFSTSTMFDCHPLIRSYFERSLKQLSTSSLRKMHSAVYEFLLTQAPELPTTPQEIAHLFQAMRHGCLAGRYTDALEMYGNRISHKWESFAIHRLGMYSQTTDVFRHFFQSPSFGVPKEVLSNIEKRVVCNQVGLAYLGMGNAKGALHAFSTNVEFARQGRDGERVCLNQTNCCEASWYLGKCSVQLDSAYEAMAAMEWCVADACRKQVPHNEIHWFWPYAARIHWALATLGSGNSSSAAQAINCAEKFIASCYSNWEELESGPVLYWKSQIAIAQAFKFDESAKWTSRLLKLERRSENTILRHSQNSNFERGVVEMARVNIRLGLLENALHAKGKSPPTENVSELRRSLQDCEVWLLASRKFLSQPFQRLWFLEFQLVELRYHRLRWQFFPNNDSLNSFESLFSEIESDSKANQLTRVWVDALVESAKLTATRGFITQLKSQLDKIDNLIKSTVAPYDPKTIPWPGNNRPKLYEHFANLKSKLRPGKKLMIGYERHRDTITRLRRKLG